MVLPLLAGFMIRNTVQDSDQVAVTTAPISLAVDLTDAGRSVIHVSETVPLRSGKVNLVYPKWIPGDHSPDGPIDNVVDFHIHALALDGTQGAEIPWRRDLVDLFCLHTEVPQGASALAIDFNYVSPVGGREDGKFGDSNHGTLRWNELEWLPEGYNQDQLVLNPTLKLPEGWQEGGSLDVDHQDGQTITFKPESLVDLNEHPVITGKYFKEIAVFEAGSPYGEHAIDACADSPADLKITPERLQQLKNIVIQERAIFGGVGHYRKYHWLLSVSDLAPQPGLEHHECSDCGDASNMLTSDSKFKDGCQLLTHEFFHSWNGKSNRPSGLVTGDYQKPMEDDLLWSYEGMTEYYGEILASRAGIMTPEEMRDQLADDAASMIKPGRLWRPLQDTADDASHSYGLGGTWGAHSRGADYYVEDVLNWLDADAIIRTHTNGAKSLDDYCQQFEGRNSNGTVFIHPYTQSDLEDALNQVCPYDWHGFWDARLNSKNPEPDMGGFEQLGWHLVFNDVPPTGSGERGGFSNQAISIGINVSSKGQISNIWINSPAWKAGLGPGQTILAINGSTYSPGDLEAAMKSAEKSRQPIQFLMSSEGKVSTVNVSYFDGPKYPHLVPIPGKPDLLTAVLLPKPDPSAPKGIPTTPATSK